ncbi:hypothetical protein J0X15_09310 [Roseibium sp. CAU 1637]|uniref:Secreted protein n=1 Tax=Roseibium limicola TaxID=2816037 RepID=A0A939EMQ1_9HYPH|nr:hypothetical protein [Roseibium limicola]MBO0345416.1 hypothetical protein [Roseibium limicola]
MGVMTTAAVLPAMMLMALTAAQAVQAGQATQTDVSAAESKAPSSAPFQNSEGLRLVTPGQVKPRIRKLQEAPEQSGVVSPPKTPPSSPETEQFGSAPQLLLPDAPGRFALVEVDGGLARLDLENGTLDICKQAADIWRCLPVPQARDAYEGEIAALSDQIDLLETEVIDLKAREQAAVEQLEAQEKLEKPENLTTGSIGEPPAAAEEGDTAAVVSQVPTVGDKTSRLETLESGAGVQSKDEARLAPEDQAQIEQMVQFSEKAMRRFFGLIQDMQNELTNGGS